MATDIGRRSDRMTEPAAAIAAAARARRRRRRGPPPAPMAPAGTSPGGTYCNPAPVALACGPVENGDAQGAGGPRFKTCPVCYVQFRVRGSRSAQVTCSRAHENQRRKTHGRPGDHTPEFKERFKKLWLEGLPRDVIAQRLGISYNAVIGLRQRMDLPPREKPQPKRKKPRSPTERRDGRGSPPQNIANRIKRAAVVAAAPIKVDRMPGQGCQWPTSDAPWRICDDARELGHPYCLEHCRAAYPNFRSKLAA